MLGELTNLPIDTLLDIVFVILAGGQPVSLSEVGELEQIQLERQRRGELEGVRLCQMAIRLKDLWFIELDTPMIYSTATRMLGQISIKSLH
jgi:hypothetical protein